MKRFPLKPPALPAICHPGKRVHHRVQIGRNVQTMNLGIVADVTDDEQLAGRRNAGEAVQESRRAYAARQRDDHSGSSPVMRTPACLAFLRMFSDINSAVRFSTMRAFSSGPASTGRAPGSILIRSRTISLGSGLSPQMRMSLSM